VDLERPADVAADWHRLEEQSLARLQPDDRRAYARARSLFPNRGRPRSAPGRRDGPTEPLSLSERQAQLRSRRLVVEAMAREAGYRSAADFAIALLREQANRPLALEVRALRERQDLLEDIGEGRARPEDLRAIADDVLRTAYRRWTLPPVWLPPSAPSEATSWNAFTPLGASPREGLPRGGQAMLLVQPVDREGWPLSQLDEPPDFDYLVRLRADRLGCTVITRRTDAWGFLAVFPAVDAAVLAARSIRMELSEASPPLHFRMALHVGPLTGTLGGFPSRDLQVCEALLLIAGSDQVLLTAAARRALVKATGPDDGVVGHGSRVLPILEAEEVWELDPPQPAAEFVQAGLAVVFERMARVPFVALPDLVGRAVTEVRRGSRLITFVGPGGSGATRVSFQVAATLSRRITSFHVVDLAAVVDRSRFAKVVAEALEVRMPEDDALDPLVARLGTGRPLLLLDSCDRALAESRHLVERLLPSCPRLTVLATATEPLSLPDETTVNLRLLSVPARDPGPVRAVDVDSSEAGRLFLTKAGEVSARYRLAEAQAGAVAELCTLLQGLPMAIELLAAMTATSAVPPGRLAEDLEAYLERQTGVPVPALPRDRLLQLAISWRLRKLSQQSRGLELVVLLLSLFPADFDAEAARFVCSAGTSQPAEFEEELRSLVRQGFVQAVEGGVAGARYRIPESVRLECDALRRYRHDLEPDVERARSRFAIHFARQLEREIDAVHGPDQQRWIDRLRREIPNFRAALLWSRTQAGQSETWASLAAAYARFLLQIGHTEEAWRTVDDGLRRRTLAPAVRLPLLVQAGLVAWRLGQLDGADRFFSEAAGLAAELGDVDRRARALDQLADVAIARGDLAEARRLGGLALAAARQTGSLSRMSFCEFSLGLAALRAGDRAAAGEHLQASLDMRRHPDHPNRLRVAISLLGLAELAVARQDLDTAREHLLEALGIYVAGWDRWGIGSALCMCAVLAAAAGDGEGAVRLHTAAQRVFRDMGQPVPATWRPAVDPAVAAARAGLPQRWLENAQLRGREMDERRAIDYALELLRGPAPAPADMAAAATIRSTQRT
jgi:predicted ATPase